MLDKVGYTLIRFQLDFIRFFKNDLFSSLIVFMVIQFEFSI